MKGLYLAIILSVFSIAAWGQAGNYRSIVATGNWNNAASWERDADSNGTFEESPSTVAPLTVTGTLTIQSGNSITFNTSANINSGGSVVVNGTLVWNTGLPTKVMNVNSGASLLNKGTITSTNLQRLKFNAGSSYFHLFTDGGTIPSAAWDATSTMNITGLSAGALTTPAGLNQTFGNFIINTPALDDQTFIDLNGAPSIVTGDFTIVSTGAGAFGFNFGSTGGTNTTLSVGGDFSISNGQFGYTSAVGTGTLNINTSLASGKGLKMTGGLFQISDDGNTTVNVNGLVSLSSGDVEFSASSASTILNVSKDFTQTSGSLSSSGGTSTINFNGTTLQTVTSTITPVGRIDFNIPVNAIVSIPSSSYLAGVGNFTLGGTLSVGATDSQGALQNTTTAGNIRVSGTRTFSAGSTIIYDGTAAQFIGNGHPTTTGVNTTINNLNGVSLIVGVPIIITTNLTLTSGDLNVGNGALTLSGNLSAGSNHITIGSLGSITISGTSSIGTFPFPSGLQTFTNFTLDNPNGVTFGASTNVVITGVLTLTQGTLVFPSNTLSLSGTVAASGSGDLSPSNSSTLAITGSGAFGTLRINPTNNTVGTFTFSRSTSGTGSLSGTLHVASLFNLNNGTFTNGGGLQMDNGSTLSRNSSGTLAGSPPVDLPAGQTYNVTYTGSTMTTGLELPNTSFDMLGTLTVNGGPVTLDKDIIVHGNINLQNSTLQASTFNITLVGNPASWTKTGGTFDGGTGSVIIAGNTTVVASAAPNFMNLVVNAGATLTLPSGNTNVGGNFQLNATSTFNNSNGTIILNGTGTQVITGAGKNFANITVNKTGGVVQLLPTVNLTGLLNVQSATTIQSNGNLTLISSSDGASGNASIGKLPSGASITGSVTAQRRMSAEGRIFRDISSSVQGATVQQIMNSGITVTGFTGSSYPCAGCATNNASMFYYNEQATGPQTNGHVGVTSAGQVLAQGRGYNLLIRNELGAVTMALAGAINSGTISLPVTYTVSGGASEDGWNLVGNPYPSTIDWDASVGWTKTNIQGNMISVWDAGANQYKTWNGSVGSLGNGRIAQGQGFFIQANGAAPVLVITEDAKTNTTGAFLREQQEQVHYLEITLTGNGMEDKAYIQNVKGSTTGFDAMDGPKLAFDGLSLSTVSTDNRKLAINAVGEVISTGQMPLRTENLSQGSYEIALMSIGDFQDIEVSILDRYTNKLSKLDKAYMFSVTEDPKSLSGDRFLLVFGSQLVTGVEQPASDAFGIYPNPVTTGLYAHIKSTDIPSGEIMDSMGKVLGTMHFTADENVGTWKGFFDMNAHAVGIYVARVRFGNTVKMIKFVKQ